MATLRATQFASGLFSDTTVHNLYTVPAGHKIILKSIQLLEAGGVAGTVNVRSSAFGTFAAVALAAYPTTNSSVHLRCWIVFEAGDILQINRSNAQPYTFVLSGSLMVI